MKRHIMFCGVGGTGKSVCAQAFAETHTLTGSITREAYKEYGIENQKVGDALPVAERVKFQNYLFGFYLSRVRELVSESAKPCVFERSPIDHLAYMSLIAPMKDWHYNMAMELLLDIEPVLVYFPYPTPWGGQDDGFRNVNAEQDTELNAFMVAGLNKLGYSYYPLRTFDKDTRILTIKTLLGGSHV